MSVSVHNFEDFDEHEDTGGGGDDGMSGVDLGIEREIEVEFPSFNLLDREDCLCVDDLWRDEAITTSHFVVCGLRLRPPAPSLSPFFLHIFAKIQVSERAHCLVSETTYLLPNATQGAHLKMYLSNSDLGIFNLFPMLAT